MLPGMTGNGFFGTADVAKNYWRLRFPSGSSSTDLGLAEISMATSVGGADLTSSVNAIASSAASGCPASEAFDDINDINSNAWFCTTGNTVGSWVGNNLGANYDIQEIIVSGDTTSSTYGPTEIVIDYSPDGSTWTNDTRWPTLTGLRWTTGAPGEIKKIRRTDTGLPVINVAGRPLFNADDTGWTGYTVRSPFTASMVPGEGGNRIRFALQPASSTGLTISAAYIGILSGTYGGTLQQVTFNGGSAGFTASAGGAAQWSDDITLTTASTDGLIISIQVSGGGGFRAGGASNGVYYKNATDASNNSPVSYNPWNATFIAGLERWSA